MAFRHITSCIPHDQYKTFPQVLTAYAVPVGLIAAIVGAIAAGGLGAAVGLGATFPLAATLAYCDWWFHYRLVCIPRGEDRCAVGTVGRTDQSTGLGDPDLDFTINLVLAPIRVDSHLSAAEQLPLLSLEHKRYLTRFYVDLDWDPDIITNLEESSRDPRTTALHCEIEGDGMKAACAAATVGAIAGVAGGAAAGAGVVAGCLATGLFFLWCLLIAAVAALVAAAVATGVGYFVGVVVIGGSKGSPADVGESGTIEAGDHVAIIGDWIYDSAHHGWHELHPVKALLKLRCPTDAPGVDPAYPDSPESKLAKEKFCLEYLTIQDGTICRLMTQRNDPAVTGAQSDPQNQWLIHQRLG